jgi:Tol biopolymer transport system component
MAPEQATADPNVDHRADIYSAGVVAYELLAGRTPFQSSTPQQMLAAQVTETPDPVAKHRPGVSPQLDSIVMRCLAKRAADRWQTSSELLAAIEPIATPSGGMQPTSVRMAAATVAPKRTKLIAIAAGVAVVAGGAWIALKGGGAPSFTLGKTSQLTTEAGMEILPAISPDGKLLAYAAGTSLNTRIFVRPIAGGRTIQLTDDSVAVESSPQFSPDANQLLFLVRRGVSVASALGGPVKPVVPPSASSPVSSASWSPAGTEIVFARDDSVLVVAATGGTPRLVGTISGSGGFTACTWSPDGRWIACVQGNANYIRPSDLFGNIAPSHLRVFPAAGGESVLVSDDSTKLYQSPVWSPNSEELFFVSNRDGARDVFVQRIGRDGHRRGEAVRLTTGANAHSISLTADGTRLAYSVFTSQANLWALPIPSGSPVTTDAAVQLTSSNQTIEAVRVSPDGKWVVFDSDLAGPGAIYRVPVNGGNTELLVSEQFAVFAGDLSPDGRELTYHSWRNGTRDIEVRPLNGGEAVRVTDTPAQESYPVWSPDGTSLAFFDQAEPQSVMVVRRDRASGWGKPTAIGEGNHVQWLPDGHIVYLGRATDIRGEIVISSADGSGKRVVHSPGANGPVPARVAPSPDGKTIYFKRTGLRTGSEFWSVPVGGGAPKLLVRFSDPARPSNRFDFAVDAKRFYFRIEDRKSDIWVAELNKR